MMKPRPHLWILLLLIPVLAGCSDKRGPQDGFEPMETDRPSSSMGSMSGTTTGGPLPPVVESPLLVMSECTSFYAGSNYYPTGTGPGTAPSGWEPNNFAWPFSVVMVKGFECNRVGLESFERGPVSFILDSHTNMTVPPDCQPNPTPGAAITFLETMIVSDQEIATYLQQEYGVPAFFGEIRRETTANGPLNDHFYSWNLPDTETSEVHVVDDGTTQSYDSPLQLFWKRGGGIGSLNLTQDGVTVQIAERPAYGAMRQPMLMASNAGGLYSGPGRFFPSISAQGAFALYRDLQCKEPEALVASA